MEIAQNAPKNDLEPLSQKVDKNYEYPQKVVENRKESVSQAEFDAFIYKTIKNAERLSLSTKEKSRNGKSLSNSLNQPMQVITAI